MRPAKAEEPSGPSLTEVERPVLAFILPNVFIPKRYLLRMTTLTDRWEWDCGCGSMIDNHTPARGIMGLMRPKGLLSSPRAVDCAAVEARGLLRRPLGRIKPISPRAGV